MINVELSYQPSTLCQHYFRCNNQINQWLLNFWIFHWICFRVVLLEPYLTSHFPSPKSRPKSRPPARCRYTLW